MVHFITASACRGGRPNNLKGLSYHSRHDLLVRLMKRRNHIRVLVAPALYGKTSLALEYAETVFSFEKVFWMDGRSPCFLRDLDKGLILPLLLESCEREGLFIVDDLPDLDPRRRELFMEMLSEFLKSDWEVLISATPSNNCFEGSSSTVMRLETQDFLLPKTLIDAYRLPAERIQRSIDSFTNEERIAALFWSHDESFDLLLDEVINEDLPERLLLAMFTILVLEQGSFEDILVFFDEQEGDFPIEQLAFYVHLGVDLYQSEFRARSYDIDLIAKLFLSSLDRMACCSRFSTSNALIARLADALLGKGSPKRACELIANMATLVQQRRWLAERSEHLMDQACLLPAYRVYENFRVSKDVFHFPLMLANAERLSIFGDEERAIALAQRVLCSQDVDNELCAQAAFFLMKACTGKPYNQALQQMRRVASLEDVFEALSHDRLGGFTGKDKHSEWKIRSILELYLHDRTDKVTSYLRHCQNLGLRSRFISQLLSRVVNLILQEQQVCSDKRRFSALVRPVLKMAYEHLISVEYKESFTYQDATLIKDMEVLRDMVVVEAYDMVPMVMKEKAHAFEVKLFSQKKEFEKEQKVFNLVEKEKSFKLKANLIRAGQSAGQAIPKISIQLFGGLVVKREGCELNPQLFSRQKLKVLLSMLVVDQGKEIPRDRLARILWPDSDPLSAQKNLHSTWSLLKKALRTSQGDCPYLVRTQLSYKLEESFVLSDVAVFRELCRSILFEAHEGTDWASVNVKINEIYRGDFLPTELENEVVIKAREDYRNRLVDCCLMGAFRLFDQGEYEMSIWFSQIAIDHACTREDAYLLLMKSQIALGQRTAALDTYFSCRKHLSEELGIDPGSSTKVLYQEIIMEEDFLRKPHSNDAIDAL